MEIEMEIEIEIEIIIDINEMMKMSGIMDSERKIITIMETMKDYVAHLDNKKRPLCKRLFYCLFFCHNSLFGQIFLFGNLALDEPLF